MQKACIRVSIHTTIFKESFLFLTPKRFKTLKHSERKLVDVPPAVIYNTVKDVENYKTFVPYCFKSTVTSEKESSSRAELGVRFGPVKEHYTSLLKFNEPEFVEAHCMDGRIFNSLTCYWKFSPVPSKLDSTVIDFHVEFEFRSVLHSKLAKIFFKEVLKKMVSAFEKEAKKQHEAKKLTR